MSQNYIDYVREGERVPGWSKLDEDNCNNYECTLQFGLEQKA